VLRSSSHRPEPLFVAEVLILPVAVADVPGETARGWLAGQSNSACQSGVWDARLGVRKRGDLSDEG